MGRLRVSSEREVCQLLGAQDFVEVRQRGSHIVMQQRTKTATITGPVPNHRELAIGTLLAIIQPTQASLGHRRPAPHAG